MTSNQPMPCGHLVDDWFCPECVLQFKITREVEKERERVIEKVKKLLDDGSFYDDEGFDQSLFESMFPDMVRKTQERA